MADNTVLVEFGAKIDSLVSGVDQVKAKLETLNTTSSSLESGFSRLRDAIIAAFSVDAVISFVEKMAELGLQTERTMATLGMSAAEVGTLSGMAQLTGTSMDSLAVQINRFSLNVQRSTADAVNPQAEALRVLGLNAKELIGVPAAEYIDKLHNAISQFNPSLNLTNALTAVGGRGFAQMLPFLLMNNEKWKEMKTSIDDAKEGLAAAIPGMADTHVKLSLMDMAIQSFGARIFSVLKPAIDTIITSITKFVESLKSDDIRTYAMNIGNWLIDMSGNVMLAFNELGITIDDTKKKLSDFFTVTVEIGEGGVADKIIKFVQGLAADIRANKLELQGDDFQLMAEHLNHAGAAADGAKTKIESFISSLKSQLGSMLAVGGATEATGGGKNASAMNEGLSKAMADRLKVIDNEYKLETDLINRHYGDFFFSEGAKTQALMAALNKRYQEEVAAGEKVTVAYSKFALDRQKILDAANKVYEAELNSAFSGLQGAINGQLRGMLAGTTSFAQGFKSIIGDMIIWAIQEFERLAFKWIAHELIQTASTESGVAARTAAEVTGTEATLPVRVAKFTSDITASAAETFAGIFGNLALLMGPAAAGPAAAGSATVLAQLAAVPKLDVGTDYVARTGFAMIHQGERIVPAQANTPFTGGGGGTNVSVSINAVDARSFANMINSNPQLFANVIKRAMRDNQLNMATAR